MGKVLDMFLTCIFTKIFVDIGAKQRVSFPIRQNLSEFKIPFLGKSI